MLPYWLLFLTPAFISVFERSSFASFRGEKTLFVAAISAIALMVGLRYQVGGDWFAYIGHFERSQYLALEDLLEAGGDPGYVLINWAVSRVGGDIWLVNLTCAVLFSYGLFSFSRSQPSPWLALVVAVPYLVIVVAMGYTRQAVAIGIAMLGFSALMKGKGTLHFVGWVLVAATFHKTAVLLIPIAALAAERGRLWVVIWAGIATVTGYYLLLADSVDDLLQGYITSEYSSEGAAIRVSMNALPAAALIVFRGQFPMRRAERRLWLLISAVALIFVPALFVLPSTAVDRLALYIIPLQVVVLSRLPFAMSRAAKSIELLKILVVLYSASVLFVWLNFGSNAEAWLPYSIYPIL